MFCPRCGFKNDQQSRHCSQCGIALAMADQFQPQMPQQPPQVPLPYYQPSPYPPVAPPIPAQVPNYMAQAVLVTLFCCLPLGIVGIFRARDVNKRLAVNDYAGARDASNSVRTILWWGFGSGLVITGLYLLALIGNIASGLR